MRASSVALVLLVSGCTGLIQEDIPEGVSPEQEAARRAWVAKAQPVLNTNCYSCHGGSMAGVEFLGMNTMDVYMQRDALLMYPKGIVDLGEPQTSLILKKGGHEGPALTAGQASNILEWIQKERDAQPMQSGFPVMLAPQAMMPCTGGNPGDATCPFNEFLLDANGATGAKVQFIASNVSGAVYVSNLKIIPGPMGVYAEHPVFVSIPAAPGTPKLDTLDRYQTVTKNLMAGAAAAMQTLGTGTASFPDFVPTDQIAVYFKALGPYKP
jgi:hypothetical protein